MADIFNNPSNDYINPGLAPCTNTSDEFEFKFLPKREVGIISGSDVIQVMNLSNIIVPVTSWTEEIKTIESGEVIYVPGLEKGLMTKTQSFSLPPTTYVDETSRFFLTVDLSINYYYNFKYYDLHLEAVADYDLNIDIANAINVLFADNNISASSSYSETNLVFKGNRVGYDFDVTNAVLNIIDASTNPNSPFTLSGYPTFTLVEDLSLAMPASKYPNGASQGYILKSTFPTTAGISDQWVYMNNVVSPFVIYENTTLELDPTLEITFDPSTILGEKPIYGVTDASGTIDASTMDGLNIEDAVITNSIILNSFTRNSTIADTSINDSTLDNVTIVNSFGSDRVLMDNIAVWDSTMSYINLSDSSIYGGTISDSSIAGCTLYNVTLVNSFGEYTEIYVDSISTIDTTDSSVYYEQFSKVVDVGRSIPGDSKILSASEYLDHVNSNNLWDKVGPLAAQISSVDPENSIIKNLVGGFYIFNPHEFTVQVEYMLIN